MTAGGEGKGKRKKEKRKQETQGKYCEWWQRSE
jgi:hypothetical protein